jgi:predicted nucleic acid-binding protein
MIVVSDTSPIRALAHLDHLPLLEKLFHEVLIPPAVSEELERPKSTLPPLSLVAHGFIIVRAPTDEALLDRLRQELDLGEAEAITLAIEVKAGTILVDESAGRAVAVREGITTMGAIGVLLRAKRAHMIPAVRPLLQRLEHELNFFMSQPLLEQALRSVGE